MGASAAETVTEIEQTRARLDAELRELERRLPSARVLKRGLAVATGSGIGGTVFLMLLKRARKRRAASRQPPPGTVVLALPEGVQRALGGEELKGWLVIGGVVWVLLRLIEIAALRRTRR